MFLRVGRQVLAWGETDVFRLLDNINPLDHGFGGFFIALDERRVPLDMVRGELPLRTVGPLDDAFLEGFVGARRPGLDLPGHPAGVAVDARGPRYPNPSSQLGDRPAGQGRLPRRRALRLQLPRHHVDTSRTTTLTSTSPGVVFLVPGGGLPGYPRTGCGPRLSGDDQGHTEAAAHADHRRVDHLPASSSLYAIVRSEAAYFHGEPFNRQGRGSSFDAQVRAGHTQASIGSCERTTPRAG